MAWTELPYTAEEIPTARIFDIQNTKYSYLIRYNTQGDFYTLYVRDNDGNNLYTTKLVAGNDAIHAGHQLLRYDNKIIPLNSNDPNTRLGFATFGNEVKLYEHQIV